MPAYAGHQMRVRGGEDAAGLVVGLVVDLDVMANKGVEVEQAHGHNSTSP